MTDDNENDNEAKPKWTGITIISSGVADDGRIVIMKQYPDRIERIVFDDLFELETILMELSGCLPKRPCPKCNTMMNTWFVPEWTCERCDQTYSANYLECYNEIEAAKVEMEKRAKAEAEAKRDEHA